MEVSRTAKERQCQASLRIPLTIRNMQLPKEKEPPLSNGGRDRKSAQGPWSRQRVQEGILSVMQ